MKRLSLFLIMVVVFAFTIAPVWECPTAPVRATAEIENPSTERALPIIMYHSVLKNKSGKYIITPETLDADFAAISAAGFTPVFMREVVAFVDGVGELPQKPMVITFDDGHYNNLLYALPIAKKYGFKIVISPVTIFSKKCVDNNDVKNPNYSHLSFAAMSEAVESGLVEFGNHTHNMHRIKGRYGISQMSTETDAEYRAALSTDVQMAQAIIEQATHIRPTTFAYPFGKYNSTARGVLVDLGFRAMLTCNEHVNKVFAGNTESLYALGRFNRDADFSTDEVMGKLTREPKVYKLK